MHPQLLQKAVDELNKESPRLDYIRGLLETLIEISPKPAVVLPPAVVQPIMSGGKPAIRIGQLPKEKEE